MQQGSKHFSSIEVPVTNRAFDMNPNRHDNKIGNLGLRNGINSKQ